MAQDSAKLKLITAARLIDGKGGPPLERGALLIEGDIIRAVGTEESVVPPEAADVQVLHYEDKTVLPGLIDCHVHLNGFGDGRMGDDLATLPDEVLTLQAAHNARKHLFSGVTTVRDCGAKHRTTLMLREAAMMGITPAPRLVLAGRPLAIIGGHLSYFGVQATGPDECRAAVRQLVKEGADFIKITATGGSTRTSFTKRPSFNVDELKAIVEEVHKFGKHTVAHCVSSQGIINCLDAGVDTIVHGFHRDPDGTMRYQPRIAERMAEQGVFLNPTIYNVPKDISVLEAKMDAGTLGEHEQADIEEFRVLYDYLLESFAKNREAGVTQVCGSDSAWDTYPMGGFQHEVGEHVKAGMSPMEAIVSATADSARSCWTDEQVGTLEEGKQADVLVVDGDPSEDIGALHNVVDVFQAGDIVDRGNYV